MVTVRKEIESQVTRHREATARVRAIHNDERLTESVTKHFESNYTEADLTPREDLKRK